MYRVSFPIILFFQLAVTVCAQNFDSELLRKINLKRPVALDGSCRIISKTVTPMSIALPVTLFTVGKISGNQTTLQNGIKSGIAITVSWSLTTILKYVVNRQRPYESYSDIQRLSSDHTPSFPSGHTTSAFCTATSLSLMYPKWYVIVPSYSWAACVSYSRMHLGMHYPTDVIVGAILGAGISVLSFKTYQWIGKK
jgi:membrane-associated phospholipid phosphatase